MRAFTVCGVTFASLSQFCRALGYCSVLSEKEIARRGGAEHLAALRLGLSGQALQDKLRELSHNGGNAFNLQILRCARDYLKVAVARDERQSERISELSVLHGLDSSDSSEVKAAALSLLKRLDRAV